jgi:hypothetical protein
MHGDIPRHIVFLPAWHRVWLGRQRKYNSQLCKRNMWDAFMTNIECVTQSDALNYDYK